MGSVTKGGGGLDVTLSDSLLGKDVSLETDLVVLATGMVPVAADASLPPPVLRQLEPWPLADCRPFQPDYLAGHLARTYDVDLAAGFKRGRMMPRFWNSKRS